MASSRVDVYRAAAPFRGDDNEIGDFLMVQTGFQQALVCGLVEPGLDEF